MNKFTAAIDAIATKELKKENKTTTENGAKAFKSTLNANLDFFSSAGASRGKSVLTQFTQAYREDADIALRNALYLRDIRGGAGERDAFREVLTWLASQHPKVLVDSLFLEKVAEVGRWDDLLLLVDRKVDRRVLSKVVSLYKDALNNGNRLAAKWAPRKCNPARNDFAAIILRQEFGWTPKFYRKRLVELTEVVETKMCAKEWDTINFNHVPSKAMTLYSRAFLRNATTEFNMYKEGLSEGTSKVNASAVFPHDIYVALQRDTSNDQVFESQWDALPNYIPEGINILPMIDVSGSMEKLVPKTSISCMDVAIGLGLYVTEKTTGDFKGHFLTFSEQPRFSRLPDHNILSLRDKFDFVRNSKWGYSTNINLAFKEILNVAKAYNVPQEDMPQYLLILSDMQFDSADNNKSGFGMAKEAYKKAGYELPRIIFWNLNDYGNKPVTFDKEGTALISGYSPSVVKAVLSADFSDAEKFTPLTMMLDTLMNDRYNVSIANTETHAA